jgi:hypothetical protein
LQYDGSRLLATGAVVGVAVLGFRALWRSKRPVNGKAVNGTAVNGHARRASASADREAAGQFSWVGPVALTLLRSPIVSTWLARHVWHRREPPAAATRGGSPSDSPATGPVPDRANGEPR